MRDSRRNITAWLLIAIGVLVVLLSPWIVFPGLESLLGIEALVGRENVVYLDGGGYAYTNPGAMMFWIGSAALIGIILIVGGTVILFAKSGHSFPVADGGRRD